MNPRATIRIVLLVSITVALATSCLDFSVPDGVRIRCSSDTECPATYACNEVTSQCVPASRDDLDGPVVLTATADRTVIGLDDGGAARDVIVTLEIDEAIVVSASELTLLDPTGDRAFAKLTHDDGPSWHATYSPDGDETQAVPLQLRAALEDKLGNRSTAILPITLTFDYTAPALAADPAPFVRVIADPANPLALEVNQETQTANTTADVQIGFTATEALEIDAIVVRAVDNDDIALVLVGSTGASVQLRATVGASALDGTWPLQADLVDLAGNRATVDLGIALRIDVNAPAPPDVVTVDRIVFERAPWGRAEADATFDDYRVVGTAGAVEANARVLVFRDFEGTREVARMLANENGAFGGPELTDVVLLETGDLRAVTVRAADAAGNLSAPVVVQDTTWTATLAGRTPGDDVTNPHRLESVPVFTAGRAWDALPELGDADGAGALDGAAALTRGAGTWERVPTDAIDLTRAIDSAVGHDPLRGQTVLFGGAGQVNSGNFRDGGTNACGGALDLLFVRERAGPWRSVAVDPISGPPGMRGAHMTFDADRERLVLVGATAGAFQQWEWDGARFVKACTSTSCQASAPALAESFGLAFDPMRHTLVVFQGSGATAETWSFDGVLWQRVCVGTCADEQPAVTDAVLDYSDALGEVVLVGAGALVEEVWSFDGAAWVQRCTDAACVASSPPARALPAVAVDRAHDEIVLFGGGSEELIDCSFNALIPYFQTNDPANLRAPPRSDTWIFDGALWRTGASGAVPPRQHAQAVWEEAFGQLLLVGGDDCECATDISVPNIGAGVWQDAHAWDGAQWSEAVQLAPPAGFIAAGPMASGHHAATHDPETGRVVIIGGALDRVVIVERDRVWRGAAPLEADLVRYGSELSTTLLPGSIASTQPVLFSGTPVSGQNLQLDSAEVPRTSIIVGATAIEGCGFFCAPPVSIPTAFGAFAGDGTRVVLFGGIIEGGVLDFNSSASEHVVNYLWSYDFESWHSLCEDSPCIDLVPSARMGAQFSPLPDGRLVLFGGANAGNESPALGDAWIFDGVQWFPLVTDPAPPARVYASQALDPKRGAVIVTAGLDLFGRASTSTVSTHALPPALDVVWELVDDTWSPREEFDIEGDGRPSARFAAATAWDAQREGVVVHGGIPSPVLPIGGVQTDLSVALSDAWRWRGGEDTRPAQRFRPSLAAAAFDDDTALIAVELTWRGTSASSLAGVPTDDATLLAWDGRGWRALTTTSCGSGCVRWNSADDMTAAELRRLFTGPGQRGSFVITPAGTNGAAPGIATIATDAVEVRVRARPQ